MRTVAIGGKSGVQCGMALRPFHMAFLAADVRAARHFDGTVLGCPDALECKVCVALEQLFAR